MGKASKWFRGLFGLKNTDTNQNQALKPPPKKKWSFAKSHKEKSQQKPQNAVVPGDEGEDDASKHAIAVAAATAAVAEAAVAAAQAAAAVVQLTSSGRNITMAGSGGDVGGTACVTQSGGGYGSREEWAAVIVQSHFRAYLSRRALRALKALVKLQALVRGHLIRKQTAYTMRRLQALVRAQVRARAGRVLVSESPHSSIKSSHYNYPGPATPEKFEQVIRARSMRHEQLTMLKRNGSKSRKNNRMDRLWEQVSNTKTLPTDDENRSDKILEVDPGNSHTISKRRSLFYSSYHNLGSDQNHSFSTSKDSTARQSVLSPSSGEVQSLSPLKFTQEVNQTAFCTAENSPTFCSASTKSCLSGFSDHPNYMSYTQSSKAKVRSVSAPKQRLSQFERSSSTKRYSVHGCGESRSASVQRVSASFGNRGYPGSGRLDRFGMPVRGDVSGFSGGLNRY